jgi:hypothetical protein
VAVSPQEIFTFEIKSKKDKLDRLAAQAKAFSAVSHHFVAVLDQKWFVETRHIRNKRPDMVGVDLGDKLTAALDGKKYRYNLWVHPRMHETAFVDGHRVDDPMCWHDPAKPYFGFGRATQQPHAFRMLNLLWKAELLAEARAAGLNVVTRDDIGGIIRKMVWGMTGQQVCEAVCRQLRQRDFAEADAPIVDAVTEPETSVAGLNAEPQLCMFEGAE